MNRRDVLRSREARSIKRMSPRRTRLVHGPSQQLATGCVGDPDAGFHRRNGTYVREPRPVALLGLVQQGYGLLPVALGMGDQSHRHEPPVAALGHRRGFTEGRGPLEVSIGGLKVPDFVVHLAESHVQVGGGPQDGVAVRLAHLQCSLVEPACLAGVTCREPHVREHRGAGPLVDQVAGRVAGVPQPA
jgi:hypothetical protein